MRRTPGLIVLLAFLLLPLSLGAAAAQLPSHMATPQLTLAQRTGEPLNVGTGAPAAAAPETTPSLVGWQLQPGPDGTIDLDAIAAATGWDDQFGYPGASFQVTTVAAGSSGVYIGLGPLSGEVGYQNASYIARWDGRRWHTMAGGLDSTPAAIAVAGEQVYVVGDFERAGDRSVGGVARWDNAAGRWSPVGDGTGPRDGVDSLAVSAVAVLGDQLYIGGEFVSVDGVEAVSLARWDGAAWWPVGEGLDYEPTGDLGEVFALTPLPDGRLAVGGKFTHAYDAGSPAGRAVNHIALWDPAQGAFSALGAGVSGSSGLGSAEVYAIAAVGDTLYVGGSFLRAGGVTANNIARWQGGAWGALGGSANGVVTSLASHGGLLYAGGGFGRIGGVEAHRLASWSGSAWRALDTRSSDEDFVNGLAVTPDGTLYAGGDIEQFETLQANHIAAWREDEGLWRPLGYGLARASLLGLVNAAVVLSDGRVIVGGDIGHAGGRPVRNLAIWDPATRLWAGLAGGTDDDITTLALAGQTLYVGGRFNQAGGIAAPYVAALNLATGEWSALGSGLNGAALAFAFAPDGVVYVGGSFTVAGGAPANRLALWNPATGAWSAPPFEFTPPVVFHTPRVLAIAPDANGAYIGGDFFGVIINGQRSDVNSLIYWERATGRVLRFGDGATELNSGNDLKSTVGALLLAPDGSLFVGGAFDKIGPGVGANRIARLTPQGWQPLGAGVVVGNPETAAVTALAGVGSQLFVGGVFDSAGGAQSPNIAIWNLDAGAWQGLGSGLEGGVIDSEVNTLAVGPSAVFAGGEFASADGAPAGSFAAWRYRPDPATLTERLFLPLLRR